MRRRLRLGRDAEVISESADVVEVESDARLRPGQLIELIHVPSRGHGREACVISWQVAHLGKEGPTYRGRCRWQ